MMKKFLPSSLMLVLFSGVADAGENYESDQPFLQQDLNQEMSSWSSDASGDSRYDEQVFLECASFINDAVRLACFDSLAQGNTPSALPSKRQIVLSESIITSVKDKKAQVVYAQDEIKKISTDDVPALQEAAQRYTPLSLAFDLDRNHTGLWRARPHNPMYILPLYMNGNPNRHPKTSNQPQFNYSLKQIQIPELKFQISVKAKAAENLLETDADLWFGYTQQSHWQVYNGKNSRPFRAHDYQPELFITQPVKADLPKDGKLRMLGAGLVHHSNGEKDPLSRSWNRAYVMAGMEWNNLTVMPRLWMRVADGEGKGKKNDNPDITDYYGYGDVKFLYQLGGDSNVSGTLRYNPISNKGAVQLDYVHLIDKGISGYVQLFHGYGQSLIDYNHESTGIGVGVMLNDWMGL